MKSLPTERPRVAVVIPALNEQESIALVLKALPLRRLQQVVVVDNGSTDETAARAAAVGGPVQVVREPRRGYGQACLTGIASLDPCDIVVFLDADLSDHPEEVGRLVAPIVRGRADFVVGSRMILPTSRAALMPVARFGNRLACTLMRLLWRTRWTDLGPFRAIRADALARLRMEDRNFGWTVEMQIKAARARLRCREVPVRYRARIGESKISGTVMGSVRAGYKILYTIARYGLVRGR